MISQQLEDDISRLVPMVAATIDAIPEHIDQLIRQMLLNGSGAPTLALALGIDYHAFRVALDGINFGGHQEASLCPVYRHWEDRTDCW